MIGGSGVTEWNLVRPLEILESGILPRQEKLCNLDIVLKDISITMKSYLEPQVTWNL